MNRRSFSKTLAAGLTVKREGYDFKAHKASIVAGLNDCAMALNDLGLGETAKTSKAYLEKLGYKFRTS